MDLDEFKNWDDTRFYNEVIKIAENHPDKDMRELATIVLPSLRGLTNFVFEAYDLDRIKSENELTDSQKEFYTTVRNLVKKDTPLHRKLLQKDDEKIVFLDAQSQADVQKIIHELEQAGISRMKLNTLISWRKTRSVYNPQDPIYLKNSKEQVLPLQAYIAFFNNSAQLEVNGVLALPMQMKENGFSIKEIDMVQNNFRRYNFEHKKEENKLPSTLMDSVECVNNMMEDMEL